MANLSNPTVPARTRRRSSSADPLKKLTIRLHERVATAVREAVDAGEAPSADALIEDAVVALLRAQHRQRMHASYAAAAADPAFMAEMSEVTREFDHAVGDGFATNDR